MIVAASLKLPLTTDAPCMSSKHRDAFTLIETLVAVSVGSLLALMAIQLLHRSFDISSLSRQQLHQELTLNRLARDLRQDLGMASGVSVKSNRHLEIESVKTEQISWEILEDGKVNRKGIGGGVHANESYQLMEDHQVTFSAIPVLDQQWHTIGVDVHRPSELGQDRAKLLRRIEVVVRSTIVSLDEQPF
jgi:prepilin-type N-terminal cleavage/methylation domain-containing protein